MATTLVLGVDDDRLRRVGTQTTVAIFDGGPDGKEISNLAINVPMTCQ